MCVCVFSKSTVCVYVCSLRALYVCMCVCVFSKSTVCVYVCMCVL